MLLYINFLLKSAKISLLIHKCVKSALFSSNLSKAFYISRPFLYIRSIHTLVKKMERLTPERYQKLQDAEKAFEEGDSHVPHPISVALEALFPRKKTTPKDPIDRFVENLDRERRSENYQRPSPNTNRERNYERSSAAAANRHIYQ